MTRRWKSLQTDADYIRDIIESCVRMPNGCLEWQRGRGKPPRHYGSAHYHGKSIKAHRLLWVLTHGKPPKGMVVMHTCDNPPCCDIDHMKLGTHLENMADCRAKNRYHYANLTECKRGHPFDDENTYIIKTPGKWFGLRACKMCCLGQSRVKRGWDPILAYSLPPKEAGRRLHKSYLASKAT